MMRSRLLGQGIEALLAVLLVLACFLIFTSILLFSFPRGISLQNLIQYEQAAASADKPPEPERAAEERSPWQKFVASLVQVRRSVKRKQASSIVWLYARPGQSLEDSDAVQTYQASAATILFDAPSELQLGENSMVVLRRLEKDTESSRKRASIVLLEGELRGSIAVAGRKGLAMEVIAGRGSARIGSGAGRVADFRVAAGSGEKTTFSVFSGTAEVTAGGQTVLVRPDYMVTVGPSGPPSAPVRLPGAPSLDEPQPGAIVPCRTARAAVGFSWRSGDNHGGYHLVIARDPQFEEIVLDRRVAEAGFTHGDLRAGQYHWKVSALNGEAEGRFSPPRELTVLLDTDPPPLRADFPEGTVAQRRFVLRGATEPGAIVFIGDRRVPTAGTGEFEQTIDLEPGINVLVVEAVDAAGNVTYDSRLVSAKY